MPACKAISSAKHFLLTLTLAISVGLYAQTACPPNIDLEEGSFNNWQLYTGSCCAIVTPTLSGPVTSRHEIMTGPAMDKYGNFPVVAPSGGVYSLKLGNDSIGSQAERARYYVHVPATASSSYMLIYQYAVVFQDPGHLATEQPRFQVIAYDSASNQIIPCTQYNYVASAALPGFKKSTTAPFPVYKDWTTSSIDLSGAKGKTVAVDFATGDCALGGHFGYGYVDISCGLFRTYVEACKVGDSVTLMGPPGFEFYNWYDSSFSRYYGSGITKNVFSTAKTMTYAVIITPYPGYGCPDTLYTTVSTEYYKAFAAPDTAICLYKGQSDKIQLKATTTGVKAPFRYYWTPSSGLSCVTCPNPVATISNSSGYTLTIIDSSNCVRTDTVIVNVIEKMVADVTIPRDTVCQYEPITIKNNFYHLPGAFYGWGVDTGKVKSYDTTGGVTVNWNTTGLKKIVLNARNGICSTPDSAYLYVKPTAVAAYDLNTTGCIGKEVTLTPKPTEGSYHWTLTQQQITDTVFMPQYKFTWNDTGLKTVTLRINAFNGCSPPIDTSTIYINNNPPVDIVKAGDGKVCLGDKLTLTTVSGRDYVYGWSPAEYFQNNNYHEATMNIEKSTWVGLSVTNRWGCNSIDSTYLEAGLCCKVFMPDAFTPNKDGTNDVYKPIAIDNHTIHTFIITNRWGQVVYNSNDVHEGWNGNFKFAPQPIGTYYYYLRYICNDGGEFIRQGSFELLR